MSRHHYEWAPYVSVAERRADAEREIEMLRKKGQDIAPVIIDTRAIATTFWGKAWCQNLESYSDFEYRLPRGRSYARNRAVLDLQIAPLSVKALVRGSSTYRVTVKIAAAPEALWRSICKDCAGGIDSLVELLQGRLSTAVMERICRQNEGLFPRPSEIGFSCSCPDFADMCKHVAAVLYGVGARLDEQPDLLFRLRKVDEKDLIAKADGGARLAKRGTSKDKILANTNLAELFGLPMAAATAGPRQRPTSRKKKVARAVGKPRKPRGPE